MDTERKYTELIFRSSKKYASWDPEIVIEVGDWGRITAGRSAWWAFWRRKGGVFLKEGNIYKDKIADQYEIPQPTEYGNDTDASGMTWITSQNAESVDISASAGG
jgi:hypothetical protein